jgi:hypothetical protein
MLFEKKNKTKKEKVVLDRRQAFMNRMGNSFAHAVDITASRSSTFLRRAAAAPGDKSYASRQALWHSL